MIKTEFIFKLNDKIFYHKDGDVVYVDKLILKAPSTKNRRNTNRIRQAMMQAIKEIIPIENKK